MFTIGNGIKLLDELGNPLRENNKFVYRDKTEDELRISADVTMKTILHNCSSTHYIGYIKGNNTTTFRKTINPEYKANRNQQEPSWWKPAKQHLIEKWGAVEVHNIEVDDAVNITRLNLPDSFIVAIDGDLLGLEGTHFKWRSKDSLVGKWVIVDEFEAKRKFWSDMICGQIVDNIKGIPGKGEAFVKKLFAPVRVDVFSDVVYRMYLNHFGEYKGIQEFYKNYMALKTLNSHEGFVIPEPIKVPENEILKDIF